MAADGREGSGSEPGSERVPTANLDPADRVIEKLHWAVARDRALHPEHYPADGPGGLYPEQANDWSVQTNGEDHKSQVDAFSPTIGRKLDDFHSRAAAFTRAAWEQHARATAGQQACAGAGAFTRSRNSA